MDRTPSMGVESHPHPSVSLEGVQSSRHLGLDLPAETAIDTTETQNQEPRLGPALEQEPELELEQFEGEEDEVDDEEAVEHAGQGEEGTVSEGHSQSQAMLAHAQDESDNGDPSAALHRNAKAIIGSSNSRSTSSSGSSSSSSSPSPAATPHSIRPRRSLLSFPLSPFPPPRPSTSTSTATSTVPPPTSWPSTTAAHSFSPSTPPLPLPPPPSSLLPLPPLPRSTAEVSSSSSSSSSPPFPPPVSSDSAGTPTPRVPAPGRPHTQPSPVALLPPEAPVHLAALPRRTLSASHLRQQSLSFHSTRPSVSPLVLSIPPAPPTVLFKGLLLGLGSPSFRLLVLVSSPCCKLSWESSLYCCTPFHLGLYLENLSFHRLVVGYSLSLLWIFSPQLGFLLSLSQALSLLADCVAPPSTDPETRLQKMEPYPSPSASSVFLPESSSASSSSPSSQNQLHSRTIVQHRVTTAEAISSTTGVSSSPPNHVYRSTNHQHHRHHNDHNHDNTANSSGSSINGNIINLNNNFNNNLRNIHSVAMPPVTRIPSTMWQAQASSQAPPHEQSQAFDPLPQEYDEDEPLEGDEDRQSDEGSEGEPGHHDMEFWLQRCSICFDARLDFCLEFCRDQFCRNCFQRYVKEVVSNSWGLDVTKIKCPVCQDAISVSEWTKYVDPSTLAQYHQYNQPYRSFSRFCNECDHELVVSKVNRTVIGLPASSLIPLFDNVLTDLKTLLTRAGLNVDDPAEVQPSSLTSTNTPREQRSRTLKRHREPSSRDEAARKIVQRFIDDYRSYCGVSQGAQQSLPSRAQAYLSNLASRALGVSFTQPTPPPLSNIAPLKSSESQQQTDSTPSLSSLEAQLIQASQSNWPPAPGFIHQIIETPHQRKQHSPGANGVLDIYKPLVTSLLDLFDLRETEYGSVQLDPVGNTNQDQSPAGQNSLEMNHQDLVIGATDTNTGTNSTGAEWKESVCTTTFQQSIKVAQAARQRIVTRAESKRQTEIKRSLVQLSKQLSSLETRPEQWKELQFLHVRWLRWDLCNNCGQDLCLQCGESSHHDTKNCFGYMRSLISENNGTKDVQKKRLSNTGSRRQSTTSPHTAKSSPKGKRPLDQDTSTIQWKLANTNPCPNCCILIHRDDGCNKVDCMLCGHRFCWICRETWGAACGFFKCGRRPMEDAEPKLGTNEDSEAMDEDTVTGEGQVQSLAVSDGVSEEIEQDQASPGISRQDRRRRRSEDLSAMAPEKPEIGVPNVFVIHTKRSRA